jgi:hypothetical protein
MKVRVKESARSEEVREELRKQGWTIRWTAQEELTRFSYWNNGVGKSLLLMEHAVDLKWNGWDIYVQLTPENNTAKTYAALAGFSQQEVGA